MVDDSGSKVLAVYDDAPVFGGHEQMSCCAIDALAREPDLRIVCLYYEGNEKLREKLKGIQGDSTAIELIELPFCSRKFQGVRSRYATGKIDTICQHLRQRGATAMLVLQGDIELSSLGVIAGNRLGIPTISYIPVPHTLATMGAKLGPWRDPLNTWLFNRPDSYITISEGMKHLLMERGTNKNIEVVLNGFDASKTEKRDRSESRDRLGLPRDRQLIAMVGRIEYKQKRQDFLLQSFSEHRRLLPNAELVYVGSGPDSDDLKSQASSLGLSEAVTFIAWTDGLSDVYSAIDVLVLPSRFEGVPLVMLEAMSVGVPVVGTARDGMKEFLPSAWLFPPDDKKGCAERLQKVLEQPQPELIEANRRRALNDFSMAAFERSFIAATRKLGSL